MGARALSETDDSGHLDVLPRALLVLLHHALAYIATHGVRMEMALPCAGATRKLVAELHFDAWHRHC